MADLDLCYHHKRLYQRFTKVGYNANKEVFFFYGSIGLFKQLVFLDWFSLYSGAFLMYIATLAKLSLNISQPVLTTWSVATIASFFVLIFHKPFFI
jgi:hypothetical protein